MRRPPAAMIVAAALLVPAFCVTVWLTFGASGGAPETIDRFVRAAREVGAANVVSAIYLNVRLLDTLLEVLVFAVAVLGVRHYLTARGRAEAIETIPESRIVRVAADVLLPLILLIGVYVTLHGHLSPGGGFSGGVIAGTGLLLAAMALGTDVVAKALRPPVIDRLEQGALLSILLLAVAPILLARPPLSDLLPPGSFGRLGSGGSILLYNGLIGIKVFIGSWLVVRNFVDHRGEI